MSVKFRVNRENQEVKLPIPFSMDIELAKKHPRFQEFLDIVGNTPGKGFGITKIDDFKYLECLEDDEVELLNDIGNEFGTIYIEDFFGFIDKQQITDVEYDKEEFLGDNQSFEKGELVIAEDSRGGLKVTEFVVVHKGKDYVEYESSLVVASKCHKIQSGIRDKLENALSVNELDYDFVFSFVATKKLPPVRKHGDHKRNFL